MTITFHCEHCSKKIKAPDSAGGKWRMCPTCHNRIYVPGADSDEDIKLAPVDREAEAMRKELMAETYQLTQEILQERDIPDGTASASAISDKELTKRIITYLRQVADGELNGAQETSNMIVPYNLRAREILDRIAVSEMPEPELADVPPQVLSGLIRDLRTRIS
ncbi:MAG: hypothetical protein ACYSTF_10205 [Planctomycetota bacterium]|jgi:hypothetical protein